MYGRRPTLFFFLSVLEIFVQVLPCSPCCHVILTACLDDCSGEVLATMLGIRLNARFFPAVARVDDLCFKYCPQVTSKCILCMGVSRNDVARVST